MSETSRFLKGRSGEDEAVDFLVRSGIRVLERNFRCPGGEIDIIARDGRTILFIEVRSKRSQKFGTPEGSITPAKMKKISRAARWYLKKSGLENSPARIDVIAIIWDGGEPLFNWIVNAFEAV